MGSEINYPISSCVQLYRKVSAPCLVIILHYYFWLNRCSIVSYTACDILKPVLQLPNWHDMVLKDVLPQILEYCP